jgi:putative tricarboxylic transport membrane protein
MFSTSRRSILHVVTALIFGWSLPVLAQTWPTRPITVIVPFDAGGQNDRIARIAAPFLSKELGQPVTVINKPGAGAMLGHTALLAADDGHTIAMTGVDRIPLNIQLAKASFALQDFDTLNLSSGDYSQMIVLNDSAIKSAHDLWERLRRDPGSVSFGVQSGGTDIINLTIWLRSAGVDPAKVRIMNTTGGGPTRAAVISKTVDVAVVGAEGNIPLRDKVRGLLVFADQREPAWRDVPTNVEFAREHKVSVADWVPGSQRTWTLSTAFSRTNPAARARWVTALEKVHKDPEAVAAFRKANIDVTWLGAERTSKLYLQGSNNIVKYVDLIRKP